MYVLQSAHETKIFILLFVGLVWEVNKLGPENSRKKKICISYPASALKMPIEIRGVAAIKHLGNKDHFKTKFSTQFSGMIELSTQKWSSSRGKIKNCFAVGLFNAFSAFWLYCACLKVILWSETCHSATCSALWKFHLITRWNDVNTK